MARGRREKGKGCHWFLHHLCFALVQLCVCVSLSLFLSLASVCECHSVCCVPFKKFSFILSLLVFSSRPALSPYLGLSFVSFFALRQCDWFTFYNSSPAAALHLHLLLAFIIMLQSTFFLSPFFRTTSVVFLLFHNLLVSLKSFPLSFICFVRVCTVCRQRVANFWFSNRYATINKITHCNR